MANNRMYLVYRPTGDSVYLGKRMGWGWYGTPDDVQDRILSLFEKAECSGGTSQDDFAIALEQGKRQPHVIDDWQYDESDRTKLKISDSVPSGTPESI